MIFLRTPLFELTGICYLLPWIKTIHWEPEAFGEEVLWGGSNVHSKGDVLDALKEVVDPEIGMNIVDVGLVYRVEPSEDKVEVDYTLTSPGCPLADVIERDITEALQRRLGIESVVLNLVWNPPWSLDFMSEEARLELGFPI